MFLGILIEPCYGNHERCKSKTEAGVENHHFSQKRLKNLLDCAVFDLYRYLFIFYFLLTAHRGLVLFTLFVQYSSVICRTSDYTGGEAPV